MTAPQSRTRFTPLWDEVGEVCDDLADLRDSLRDGQTPKWTRRLAEAWCEGRCAIHLHLRIGTIGGESKAHDLSSCLPSYAHV